MQDTSNILQGWSLQPGDYLFLKTSLKEEKEVNITFFRYSEKENDFNEKSDKKITYKVEFLSIFIESSLVGENGKTTVDLIKALTGISLVSIKKEDEELVTIKSLGIPQLSEALIFRF